MANNPEAQKKREEQLVYVVDPDHPGGGYDYAINASGQHGTRSTYTNWGCRCPDCVLANSNRQRKRRHDAKRIADASAKRTLLFQKMSAKVVLGISARSGSQAA